jgi:glycosyltransferase involved in cell wall biosynthesis
MIDSPYVLLTAARDEEACIGEIIQSVLRQTVRPVAWFIMDDGSTDRTASIVRQFAAEHPFIHLQSADSRGGRNFGSQYKAIMAAYDLAKPLGFEFVGVHDADIVCERNDYYEFILREFKRDEHMGIAGGFIKERANGIWKYRKSNSEDSVAGGVQMFRRVCFDQIGGYTPLYHGGSDWLAQIAARMAGWENRAYPELPVFHHRPSSSANGRWRGLFRMGQMDASFGSHPVFEIFKCCRRIGISPFFIGSLVRLAGYGSWILAGRRPSIPPESVAFLRAEQMGKLKNRLWRLAGGKSGGRRSVETRN